MSLLILPNELLIHVAKLSTDQSQAYAMALSCRRLYYLLRKYMLQYNVRYRLGSALIWAARRDRRNLVRRLLRLGAKPNTRGIPQEPGTPLHYASAVGHLGMVELLLKERGDVDASGAKGFKPLLWALLSDHEDIAVFLFSKMSERPDRRRRGLHTSTRSLPLSVAPISTYVSQIGCRCKYGDIERQHTSAPCVEEWNFERGVQQYGRAHATACDASAAVRRH